MPVVLDSSFLIDVDRGHKGAMSAWKAIIASAEVMLVPAPVFVEVVSGARKPDQAIASLREATHFLMVGERESLAAAALARRARKQGTFPGWNDILIAACAKEQGDVEILTANPNHFPFSRTRSY